MLPTENFSGSQRTKASAHWGTLYLMEKARLYVAADGNSELYAYYASMQSCLYSIAAYSSPKDVTLQVNHETRPDPELDRQHCLMWARRLRDHALLAYADTGYQCYNAIKAKSGLPRVTDEYGQYLIEKLPAIFEVRETENAREASETDAFLTLNISLLVVNINNLPKLTINHPKKNIYLFGTNACYLFFARGLSLLCSDTTNEFGEDGSGEDGSGEDEGADLENTRDAKTAMDWPGKLTQARRLFDMAWAIAEDGCNLVREPGSDRPKIVRSFSSLTAQAETQYTTPEIESVRDLYPRRINEIADLGKIFSAACMVLHLYALTPDERSPMIQNIEKILSMFHGAHRLEINPLFKEILLQQERYNGYIESHLLSAQRTLKDYMTKVPTASTDEEIKDCRHALLQALFAGLMGEC